MKLLLLKNNHDLTKQEVDEIVAVKKAEDHELSERMLRINRSLDAINQFMIMIKNRTRE